jgi:hypothetical protein
LVVFAIGVPPVAKLSGEDSQRTTFPVCAPKVRTVLFVPEHTVVPPVTVPATVVGSTVKMAAADVEDEHTLPGPLITTS